MYDFLHPNKFQSGKYFCVFRLKTKRKRNLRWRLTDPSTERGRCWPSSPCRKPTLSCTKKSWSCLWLAAWDVIFSDESSCVIQGGVVKPLPDPCDTASALAECAKNEAEAVSFWMFCVCFYWFFFCRWVWTRVWWWDKNVELRSKALLNHVWQY